MEISGRTLPREFVDHLQTGIFNICVGSIHLKNQVDHNGNLLETEIDQAFNTVDQIEEETNKLSKNFQLDGCYGESPVYSELPGHIDDITNSTEIVCFAMSSDGSLFCFDFREQKNDPSVIWRDDCYWRVIAPNYGVFIKLFVV